MKSCETETYFRKYEDRVPPAYPPLSRLRAQVWHFLAGVTIALSAYYLHWRWTESINPDAVLFSVLVAGAETLFFLGTIVFYFDIWDEGDTRPSPPDTCVQSVEASAGPIKVDVFITTYDEPLAVVAPSVQAAKNLVVPKGVTTQIWVLDDGKRDSFRRFAAQEAVSYLTRDTNIGFKAGNLRNALFHTDGDFVLICDADTRVFPNFLANTLGYFRDPTVAWVQTPHWFYDIPEGHDWADVFSRWTGLSSEGRLAGIFRAFAQYLSGSPRQGIDPFLSDPALFFDVIQRRRNRNGASFCCGAGSLHRREAVFDNALQQFHQHTGGEAAPAPHRIAGTELQPFRFHVSEDIYTSMQLQSDPDRKWRSVFHPQVESRMLSPWTMDAWATQRLKYAGGTFDILFSDNHLTNPSMPWRTRLHYLATYWSYLAALWTPIMLVAPLISLFFGIAPVEAYSLQFFAYFLPVVISSELAMLAACKGHDLRCGRIMATGGLAIQLRAFFQVIRGRRPRFPPTPKVPIFGGGLANLRFVWPNAALLAANLTAATYGLFGYWAGWQGYSVPFLTVNLFWLGWNSLSVGRVLVAAFWRPAGDAAVLQSSKHREVAEC